MKPLVRKKLVELWHDGRNRAGDEWELNIDEHLASADIIALLVSPDFLNSDYCCEKEMSRALERKEREEAVVVPIIVRECTWEETPLAGLQAIPEGALPVTKWPDHDSAWKNVAQSLASRAREVLTRKLEILEKRDRVQTMLAQAAVAQAEDRDRFQTIQSHIARDAAAQREERRRMMDDLQSKIFALNEECGPGLSSKLKRADRAFDNVDAYIRGE